MNIFSLLQIVDYHINHCEDYLFIGEIDKEKYLFAVMDGCTMANDSYFASTLVGKILRKIVIGKSYESFYNQSSINNEDYLKSILKELFEELTYPFNKY